MRTLITSFMIPMLVICSACGALDSEKPQDEEPASPKAADEPGDDRAGGDDSAGFKIPENPPRLPDDPDDPTTEPEEREPCVAPEGIDNSPESMEDAVRLINALPQPVTISCYLEALARPLKVNATISQLSVQPGQGKDNPRIFLFSGPLVTTFVPVGAGSMAMEFSHLLGDTISVKGEIAMPVKETLDLDAPYAQILFEKGGTRCTGCHSQEEPAGGSFPTNAFKSKALKPLPSSNVDLDYLRFVAAKCDDDSERCRIYRALFKDEEVEAASFPKDMPTLF